MSIASAVANGGKLHDYRSDEHQVLFVEVFYGKEIACLNPGRAVFECARTCLG